MKAIKLFTVIALIISLCIPTYAYAVKPTHIFPLGVRYICGCNEYYIPKITVRGSTFNSALPDESKVYHSSVEDFAADVKNQMIARNNTISVGYESETPLDGTFFDEVDVVLFAHTGVPVEGDYLWFHFGGYNVSSGAYYQNGKYYYDFVYEVEYHSTSEQEQAVTDAIAPIVEDVLENCSSDYEKVSAIYRFITDNVRYDFENSDDISYTIKYSAYAALINKTAVCQGYTNLLYRLLLECGVDCRTVDGIGNKQQHGWNIIKIDGNYYLADSTWDSQCVDSGVGYEYFLRGSDNFGNHTLSEDYTTSEFTSQYPISRTDYSPNHSFTDQWYIDRYATANQIGSKSHHCLICGNKIDVTTVPYLDASIFLKNFKSKKWSIDGINFVYSNGFMGDTGNGDFEQTGKMTRSMFVTVLWRIAGSPTPDTVASEIFTDINPKQKWYHSAVAWAYENGIVTGTSATTFSPNGDVTREQIATFLYRFAANYQHIDVSRENDLTVFSDSNTVSKYAYKPLAWANAEGLIKGQASGNDSILAPKNNASREEVAVVVTRFCTEH